MKKMLANLDQDVAAQRPTSEALAPHPTTKTTRMCVTPRTEKDWKGNIVYDVPFQMVVDVENKSIDIGSELYSDFGDTKFQDGKEIQLSVEEGYVYKVYVKDNVMTFQRYDLKRGISADAGGGYYDLNRDILYKLEARGREDYAFCADTSGEALERVRQIVTNECTSDKEMLAASTTNREHFCGS